MSCDCSTTGGRPVGLRRRHDLIAASRVLRGSRRWIIKDPVTLSYFDLSEAEYAVFRLLDGRTSGEEILSRVRENLSVSFSRTELEQFVRQLVGQSLVISDSAAITTKNSRRSLSSRFAGMFSIRWRGIDPTPLLERLDWLQRIIFSRTMGVLVTAMVTYALLLVTTRFDELVARMPHVHTLFSGSNFVWLAATWLTTKLLHELGHGMTCRHFGGSCREAGFMLLFLTPCLYCDVSDTWLFRSRWRRIAVAAAGIVVELALASLATILWYYSEPGLFNRLCLNVMFISSIGAIVFNGNPLLRYDGYYILSDLIEVPNLREKSDAAVRNLLRRLLNGTQNGTSRLTSEAAFAAFSIGSFAYRTMVIIAIVLFIDAVAAPYGLSIVVAPICIVSAIGLMHGPVAALLGEVQAMRQNPRSSSSRGYFVLFGLCLLMLGLLMVPLPRGVRAAAVIEPQKYHNVFVIAAGTLIETLQPGARVEAGDVIGRLSNVELDRKLVETRGNLAELESRLSSLGTMRSGDSTIASVFQPLQARITGLKDELNRLESDRDRLTLRAPQAGIVLPPPHRDSAKTDLELAAWSGTPLDLTNRHAYLETGTLFCIVADMQVFSAVAILNQEDVEAVREGQPVRIVVDHRRDITFEGEVVEVAKVEADTLPPELADDPDLTDRTRADGQNRPAQTSYLARVRLDGEDKAGLAKGKATLRISVDPEPMSLRIYRALRRTFRIQL